MLLFRKPNGLLFLSFAFLFLLNTQLSWGQQVIGNFPAMNGGFEGATIDNSAAVASAQANKWTKNNASTTIAEETSVVRSGSKSMSITNSTTGRRVWTPLVNVTSTTGITTIQFFRRVTDLTNTQENQLGVGNGTTTDASNGTYSTPASINTWTIQTYSRSSWTYTDIAGAILTRAKGTGGTMYVDDVVVYAGSVDSSAPSSPGAVTVNNPTATSLNVSWGAASGGVDGGGYIVVRYAVSPNADNDPNQNGIYAIGNTTTNGTSSLLGTIRYIGTNTSFTDNSGLSSGTQYYYKVYTVDKAFNYSSEVSGSASTSPLITPIITASSATSPTSVSTTYGAVSGEASFNVSGTDMASGIVVTPPSTNFEVSTTSGGTFTNTVTVGGSGTIASTPVYIRLKSTAPFGSYSGNIVLSSTGGAASVNVPIAASAVSKANLNITAGNQTVTYGTNASSVTSAGSYTPTGFVNGENSSVISGTVTYTTTYTATTAATTAGVTISPIVSGLTATNYAFSPIDGSITINKATLTVTADDKTAVEGTSLPAFTVSYGPFQNGETEANLTTAPTASSPTADINTVGDYPIVVSGGVADNYNFNYVSGNFSVTSAASPVCPLSTSIAPTADQVVCEGAAASTLNASFTTAGATGTPTVQYQWYYNLTNSNTVSGATLISGATLSSYLPLSSASEIGTRYYFCVAYAADNDCGQTNASQALASNTVKVLVNAKPTASITPSGSTTFCSGGSVTLTASTGDSYLWSNGATTSAIVVTTSGDYSVQVTTNGCQSDASTLTTVTVNSLPTAPTITPSGSTTLCAGASVTLSSSSGSSYLWSNGATTQDIIASSTGSYSVQVTDGNGCQSPASSPIAVTVYSNLVPGSISTLSVPNPGTRVQISQVFGGGGNSGATYTNDYIELYNPTTSSVSLSGWSVQYTSASGTSWQVTNLSGSIAAGGYYLIQQAAGTTTFNALPTPQATGVIAMSGTAGKVALVNSTTPLSGAINNGTGATIIDFVGYGTTANGYEGTGPTPAPSNANAVFRANNGCKDTQNNASDFIAAPTAPRNSSSPTNTCTANISTQTICSGVTPSGISVSNATGSTGTYTYQWYAYNGITTAPTGSTIPVGWTALTTGTTYTPSALTQSTTFACFVTADGCESVWANGQRQVTVNPLPTATISPSGTLVLTAGTNQLLTANSSSSYLWSTSATTSSITVSAAGSYTVQVTDANGCQSSPSSATIIAYAPAVTTSSPATDITLNAATLSGAVTAAGDSAITERGIVYAKTSLDANPTLGEPNVVTLSTNAPATGAFSELTGSVLDVDTQYSFSAYATNGQGTTYGSVVTFSTLSNSPNLTLIGSAPSFGNVCTTGTSNSAVASFTFDGAYLNPSDLSIGSASSQLTFSLTQNGTYSNPLTLSNASSTITGQVVWVKFTPNATGSFNGTIAINGAGLLTDFTLSAIGNGINTPATVTTGSVSAISATGATLSGSYTQGCSEVTNSGIEYSANSNMSLSSTVALNTAVTGLQANTIYYYRAFAVDATGTVNGSILNFTTSGLAAPTANDASSISHNKFTANWTAVDGASSYRLDVSTLANFGTTTNNLNQTLVNNAGTIGASGWSETNVTQGSGGYLSMVSSSSAVISPTIDLTNYSNINLNFKARTFGGVNASNNTITVSITTNNGSSWTTLGTRIPLNATLNVMTLFNLSSYTGSQVKIRFQTLGASGSIGAGIDDVIVTGDQSFFTPSYVSGYENLAVGNVTSYVIDTNIAPLTQYYFRVRAFSTNSTSDNSNTKSVTTSAAPPTFGSVSQSGAEEVCDGSEGTFNVTGLLPNSTSTITYNINGGAPQTFTDAVANLSGFATFAVTLPASFNGLTLTVTQIERTDVVSPILTVTTNNTAVIAVQSRYSFFVDADNDGFGSTTTSMECSSSAAVAPNGFSTNDEDCDDGDAAINPGVSEVNFNNVDEDCDSSIFNGHAPVVSNVTPPSGTLAAMTSPITCSVATNTTPYSGASVVHKFRVTRTSPPAAPVEFESPTRSFAISSLAIAAYAATYEVQATAIVNGEEQPYNGNTATYTTPAAPVISTVSQISNNQCNQTLTAINSYIYASNGPAVVQLYDFEVIREVEGLPTHTQVYTTTSPYFRLTSLAMPTTYGTIYKVRSRYGYNSFGSEIRSAYSTQCTITTPSMPTVQVVGSQCGQTLASVNSFVYSTSGLGSANLYEFKVTRIVAPGETAPAVIEETIPRVVPYFRLTMLENLFIGLGKEYSVSVRYRVNTPGVTPSIQFSDWSPVVCSVFTPEFPTTGIVDAQCALIDFTPSLSQYIYSGTVTGATQYRFRLELFDEFSETSEIPVYSQSVDSPNNYITLNQFTGLLPSTTYVITVSVELYGEFGPYGKDCAVTTPDFGARTATALVSSSFEATAYPNPFANNFMLGVKTTSQSSIGVKVFDMVGRLVDQSTVNISELKNATIGDQYPSGVYNVVITQDEVVKTLRVVKR